MPKKRKRLVKGSPEAKRYMAKLRKLAAAKRKANPLRGRELATLRDMSNIATAEGVRSKAGSHDEGFAMGRARGYSDVHQVFGRPKNWASKTPAEFIRSRQAKRNPLTRNEANELLEKGREALDLAGRNLDAGFPVSGTMHAGMAYAHARAVETATPRKFEGHRDQGAALRRKAFSLIKPEMDKEARESVGLNQNPLTSDETASILATAKEERERPTRSMEEHAHLAGRAYGRADVASEFGPEHWKQGATIDRAESALFYPRPHQRRRNPLVMTVMGNPGKTAPAGSTGGFHVEYLPGNQAWIVMWHDQIIADPVYGKRFFSSKKEANEVMQSILLKENPRRRMCANPGHSHARRNPVDYQDVYTAAQKVGYSIHDAATAASEFKRTGALPSLISAQLRYFKSNPVEGWSVTQDGETLQTFAREQEAMAWLHNRHPGSIHNAIANQGYDIVQVSGGRITFSYKRDILQKKRNPAARNTWALIGHKQATYAKAISGTFESAIRQAQAHAAANRDVVELWSTDDSRYRVQGWLVKKLAIARPHGGYELIQRAQSNPDRGDVCSRCRDVVSEDVTYTRDGEMVCGDCEEQILREQKEGKPCPICGQHLCVKSSCFRRRGAGKKLNPGITRGYKFLTRAKGKAERRLVELLNEKGVTFYEQRTSPSGGTTMDFFALSRDFALAKDVVAGHYGKWQENPAGGAVAAIEIEPVKKTSTSAKVVSRRQANAFAVYARMKSGLATWVRDFKSMAAAAAYAKGLAAKYGVPVKAPRITRKYSTNPGKGKRRKITMTLQQFAKWVKDKRDPKLWNALVKKFGGFEKWTHGTKALKVELEQVNVPGVNGVWITYGAGKAPETTYIMPSGAKRKGAWVHEWETMPDLKNDPDAGIIITKLKGKSKITDFYHR